MALLILSITATGQTLKYGGALADKATSLTLTTDSSLILVGNSESFTSSSNSIYIVKTDFSGNKVWDNFFSEPGYLSDLKKGYFSSDSSIILTASLTNSSNRYFLKIIKLDLNGTILWERIYKDLNPNTITAYDSNSLLLFSQYIIPSSLWSRLAVTQVTLAGDSIKSKVFYPNADSSFSVSDVQKIGTKWVFSGTIVYPAPTATSSNLKGFVGSIDSSFSLNGFFSDSQDSSVNALSILPKTNAIKVLFTGCKGFNQKTFSKEITFDTTLTSILSKTYHQLVDTFIKPQEILTIGSNEIITTTKYVSGERRAFLFRNNTIKNIYSEQVSDVIKAKVIGLDKIAFLTSSVRFSIDSFTGTMVDTGSYMLFITDSNGKILSRSSIIRKNAEILTTYPNPFNETFSIDLKLEFPETAEIFDGQGKHIKTILLSPGVNHVEVDELPSGQYYLKLPLLSQNFIYKIIKT